MENIIKDYFESRTLLVEILSNKYDFLKIEKDNNVLSIGSNNNIVFRGIYEHLGTYNHNIMLWNWSDSANTEIELRRDKVKERIFELANVSDREVIEKLYYYVSNHILVIATEDFEFFIKFIVYTMDDHNIIVYRTSTKDAKYDIYWVKEILYLQ